MARLLLVEDDPTIGQVLESVLRSNGHDVRWESTGRSGLHVAGADAVDLILLDVGLPDLDGNEVCRRLRILQPGAVIVMLTARQDEMDVVVGLESGADDYLTKPIRLTELMARIRAHLRRGPADVPDQVVLAVGDLQVDTSARRAAVAGSELSLRPKEFDLLARLATEPGVAITRERLMCDVWDENWFGPTKTLDVHVASLRRKLAGAGSDPQRMPAITTVRGHGYRLELLKSGMSAEMPSGASSGSLS